MLIFNDIISLQRKLGELRKSGKTIGFVPTMGALHNGHISLVKKAAGENDIVVVSIFVNPTQFNNKEDLVNYPRTPEKDITMLEDNNVDILFSPEVNEIYNDKNLQQQKVNLGHITEVMEGKFRPGHFAGVVQVVKRLFEIVNPQNAYFGEKDFQQLAVIRTMTEKLKLPVNIIGCPTIREENGLAMSSRNIRLSEKGKKWATEISKSLIYAKDHCKDFEPEILKQEVIKKIEAVGNLKVEYVEIGDETTLEVVRSWEDHKHVRCFAAVFCEGVRLIDNVRMF